MSKINQTTNISGLRYYYSDRPFYKNIFIIVLIFTIVTIGIQVYNDWKSYSYFQDIVQNELNLSETIDLIQYYDEALTMSSLMASVTGDLKWEKRYLEIEPRLDSIIKRTKHLSNDLIISQYIQKADISNKEIVEIEKQAFEYIHNGNRIEAFNLLNSQKYTEKEKDYSIVFKQLKTELNNRAVEKIDSERQLLLISLIIIGIMLPLLLSGWYVVLKVTRKNEIEEKKSYRILLENEKKFRSVFEDISLIGIILNNEGSIILCNDYLLNLTGWNRDEIINKNWFENFLPLDIRESIKYDIFHKSIELGEIPTHHINEIITRAG